MAEGEGGRFDGISRQFVVEWKFVCPLCATSNSIPASSGSLTFLFVARISPRYFRPRLLRTLVASSPFARHDPLLRDESPSSCRGPDVSFVYSRPQCFPIAIETVSISIAEASPGTDSSGYFSSLNRRYLV